MRSISVILFFYGANSTDKTVTEARIAFVGPCFLNARMLVANLTYRQKTISQRFNSVVIGLIVGLLPICRKTTFKAENSRFFSRFAPTINN
jgi:hypothetical protein